MITLNLREGPIIIVSFKTLGASCHVHDNTHFRPPGRPAPVIPDTFGLVSSVKMIPVLSKKSPTPLSSTISSSG